MKRSAAYMDQLNRKLVCVFALSWLCFGIRCFAMVGLLVSSLWIELPVWMWKGWGAFWFYFSVYLFLICSAADPILFKMRARLMLDLLESEWDLDE